MRRQPSPELLRAALCDPYFSKPPPKSSGREYFNLTWLDKLRSKCRDLHSHCDILATLTLISASTIARAILSHDPKQLGGELFVHGGGAENPLLLRYLQGELSSWKIRSLANCPELSTADENIASLLEAYAFAWFAFCRLNGIPANLPDVTGASRKVLLGRIYRPTP